MTCIILTTLYSALKNIIWYSYCNWQTCGEKLEGTGRKGREGRGGRGGEGGGGRRGGEGGGVKKLDK